MRIFSYCTCYAAAAMVGFCGQGQPSDRGTRKTTDLPPPLLTGAMPLEQAIAERRSIRSFSDERLTLQQIAQLCWAGQGITDAAEGLRAAPSAGALCPIELYVVTTDGVDHYLPKRHCLQRHLSGDVRGPLQHADLDQESIGEAPACFVIAAVVERSARKYGRRADRYCYIEAGHTAQNMLLQATAMNLGGVPIGAFEDKQVAKLLKLPAKCRALYLLPIGHAE